MNSENNFHHEDRKTFRARLEHSLHPSNHIEVPLQLKGREKALSEIQDAFETSGVHPFIWGPRGIGKTSLGHTACEVFSQEVSLAAIIACGKKTTFRDLIDDIVLDAVSRMPNFFSGKKIKATLSAYGITVSAELGGIQSTGQELSINQAARLIDQTFGISNYPYDTPVLIIDEVDRLQNEDTFKELSDLLKQLSVIGSKVKFCFCGVTDDLNELISAHESVERYIFGIELAPLTHDSVWEIVQDIETKFKVDFHRGQEMRIGQIASGYPHFAHLILKNTLLEMYETGTRTAEVTAEVLRGGLNKSSSQAAARLRTAYEKAIRKGTDRYIEVLFSVANSEHMNRQFKDITTDYERIMELRPSRNGYDCRKANGQELRNALNSLTERGYLKKGKSGWYQFSDPMFRSYVRLVAETEGVELSDDVFPT